MSGVAMLGESHSGPSITCKMLRFLRSSGLKIMVSSPFSQKLSTLILQVPISGEAQPAELKAVHTWRRLEEGHLSIRPVT